MVPKKGGDAYAITALVREIDANYRYKMVILRSDQEPAILDLKTKVKKLCKTEIVFQETPVGDSQSGGTHENAANPWQGRMN